VALFLTISSVSTHTVKAIISGCAISIRRHLKKNSRMILHPDSSSTDGYRFFLPSAGSSSLTFQHGQEVVFACPNGLFERARCNAGVKINFNIYNKIFSGCQPRQVVKTRRDQRFEVHLCPRPQGSEEPRNAGLFLF
jgi:hypothetical protein